ncbi:hypothetical protein DFH09DRAFT_1088665 [Mycena vulgaris]|nr:hypothetical protein DFH09DRAFT_1088665 [Mycena vulgaris]
MAGKSKRHTQSGTNHRESGGHSSRKSQYHACSCSESHARVEAVLRKIYDKIGHGEKLRLGCMQSQVGILGSLLNLVNSVDYGALRASELSIYVSADILEQEKEKPKNWDEVPDWGLTESSRPFG